LLGEGLGVVVISLSHCFILCPLEFVPLPLLFVPLPQSLLELFDLRLVRDEATPRTCALRRCRSLLSSHMLGVDYAIKGLFGSDFLSKFAVRQLKSKPKGKLRCSDY
jgi:hypothetical protein